MQATGLKQRAVDAELQEISVFKVVLKLAYDLEEQANISSQSHRDDIVNLNDLNDVIASQR